MVQPGTDPPDLGTFSKHDLRREWQRLFRAEPPARLGRDLLVRGIAYKLQERAYGGLSATIKRRLHALALEHQGAAAFIPKPSLKPGTRLVRGWRGATYVVTVLDEGFDYEGRRYHSLSEIAREITGTHWSGPRFFGLAKSA